MWGEISVVEQLFNFVFVVLINLDECVVCRLQVDLRVRVKLLGIVMWFLYCENCRSLLNRIAFEI